MCTLSGRNIVHIIICVTGILASHSTRPVGLEVATLVEERIKLERIFSKFFIIPYACLSIAYINSI